MVLYNVRVYFQIVLFKDMSCEIYSFSAIFIQWNGMKTISNYLIQGHGLLDYHSQVALHNDMGNVINTFYEGLIQPFDHELHGNHSLIVSSYKYGLPDKLIYPALFIFEQSNCIDLIIFCYIWSLTKIYFSGTWFMLSDG